MEEEGSIRYNGRPGGRAATGQRGGERSVCLTSVSVGGLVEHEHGIVHLRGRQTTTVFFRWRSLPLLPRDILPDLSPSQVLQGRLSNRWTERRRRWGGHEEEAEGAQTGRHEETLYSEPSLSLTHMTGGVFAAKTAPVAPHSLTFSRQTHKKSR